VDAEDLFDFLRQLPEGERLSEEDVNHLLIEMDLLKVGYLSYEDFVFLLLPK
jgi:Ca2+-binding EF-hand superfamily protein